MKRIGNIVQSIYVNETCDLVMRSVVVYSMVQVSGGTMEQMSQNKKLNGFRFLHGDGLHKHAHLQYAW